MDFWTPFASWVAAMAGAYAVFPKTEKYLREDSRASLTNWLQGKAKPDYHWSFIFGELFDYLFKSREKNLGSKVTIWWPSLPRSIVASLVSVGFVFLLWRNLLPPGLTLDVVFAGRESPNVLIHYDLVFLSDGKIISRAGIDFLIVAPLLANVLPDYLSLVETRLILARIQRAGSVLVRLGWIAVDAIVTFAIAYASFVFLTTVSARFLLPHLAFLSFSSHLAVTAHDFDIGLFPWLYFPHGATVASWSIYSTFLTSIWLWLFLLSRVLVRVLAIYPWLLNLTNKWFRIDGVIKRHPLQVMGYFLMAALSIVGWGAVVVLK